MPESVKNGRLNTSVYLFSLLNSSKRQERVKINVLIQKKEEKGKANESIFS